MELLKTYYKDKPALAFETELCRVMLLPALGGKVCSLVHKPSGYEWLAQREGEKYRVIPYGGPYIEGEVSGFDDMFPTIDACHYEADPWRGAYLPDHGEVWALPWDCEAEDDALRLAVQGIRLPYRLEKRLSFTGPETLHIAYKAENPTPFDMDFLWAGHMIFNGEKGSRVTVPEGADVATCVYSKWGDIGGYGDKFEYPRGTSEDGCAYDLSAFGAREDNNLRKLYFTDPLREGFCEFSVPSRHIALRVSFSTETLPYMALLYNEGGSHDVWGVDDYNFYIEPCTAPFDRPDAAKLFGKGSVLPANGCYTWSVEISLKDL
ncbi:DUF5107 domain-containing protein [Oscillospiraceae bacterium OttesenSCG-928-F05]|nr:DUF5107 domain-containing protein [Oscillospiraceae bacterium OttesenSCG-928-F05]